MWVSASSYLAVALRSEEYGHPCCSSTLSHSHSCYQRESEMCNSDGFIFSLSFGLFPWKYKVCFHYGLGNLVASEAHVNCEWWRFQDIEQSWYVTHGFVNPVLRGEMTAHLHAYSVAQFCICRCVVFEMVFCKNCILFICKRSGWR